MTDYTAGVAVYLLLVGILITLLLVGGFLILSLGLMTKRKEDRIGGRNPSDVGLLKHSMWPEEPYADNALPAEEEDFSVEVGPPKKAA